MDRFIVRPGYEEPDMDDMYEALLDKDSGELLCMLTETEDRTFCRDLQPALKMLNDLAGILSLAREYREAGKALAEALTSLAPHGGGYAPEVEACERNLEEKRDALFAALDEMEEGK